MSDLKDTSICANCYREFADHDYVPDSIDKYRCRQHFEPCYGYFPGGDPRMFSPDYECCSQSEIDAWKAAVKEWNDGKHTEHPGGCHRCSGGGSRFGIGVYTVEVESYFEPLEQDD